MNNFIILVLLMTSPALAEDEISTQRLLIKYFDSDIEIKSESEIWVEDVGYTDIYQSEKGKPDLANYVYILYYQNEYATLLERARKEKKFRDRAKEYPRIFEAMSKYCNNKTVTSECILEGMRTELGIKECGGRSDEGYFCTDCSGKTVCEKDYDVVITPLFE